nr:hypothetical protein [Tanacetum cinerariifolium]
MMDYALWDVIENGHTLPKTQVVEGVTTFMPITSVKDKAQRRLEVKARGTLMMGIPNEHQLKFNSIKDAKQLMEAIEKRFDFKNLSKEDLDAMSMYDLYSNLKVYEPEVKGIQPSSPQLVNKDLEQIHPDDLEGMDLKWQMAMLTIKARRFLKKIRRKLTVNGNETTGFDKTNMECYNCHKRGHFVTECRAPRSQDTKHKESTRRTVPMETAASTALVSCDGLGGYDWTDQVKEGPNYALMAYTFTSSDSKKSKLMVLGYKSGLESVEERFEFFKTNESVYIEDIKLLKVKIQMKGIAITELRRKLDLAQKETYKIQLAVDKLKNESKSLNKLIDCQIVDNYKKGLGYENYNDIPPLYTGNFMPLKPDLSYIRLDEFAVKPVVENKSSEEVTKAVRKNPDAPIVQDWVSDDEEEEVTQPKIKKKTVKPSFAKIEFVKSKEQVKSLRKTTVKQGNQNRLNTHNPRGNQRN